MVNYFNVTCNNQSLGTCGPWHIYPVNNTSGFSSIMTTITGNIPWAWGFLIIMMYVALIVIFQNVPGKRKYVYISFVMMVVGFAFEMFSLITPLMAVSPVAVFLGAFLFVRMTGSN